MRANYFTVVLETNFNTGSLLGLEDLIKKLILPELVTDELSSSAFEEVSPCATKGSLKLFINPGLHLIIYVPIDGFANRLYMYYYIIVSQICSKYLNLQNGYRLRVMLSFLLVCAWHSSIWKTIWQKFCSCLNLCMCIISWTHSPL